MNRRTLISIIVIIIVVVIALILLIRRGVLIGPDDNELVHNGSFEAHPERFVNTDSEPVSNGSNCKMLCGGSGTLDSWQVFRAKASHQDCTDFRTGGAKDAVCWSEDPNTGPVTAEDGHFAMDLTGFSGRPPEQFGSIRQDVENTQPGEIYELSFFVGSSWKFPAPRDDIGVVGEVLGVPDATIPCSAVLPTQENSKWTRCAKRFKAVAPTTTINFFGRGSAGAFGNGGEYVGIDNVSLRKVCFILRAKFFGCG